MQARVEDFKEVITLVQGEKKIKEDVNLTDYFLLFVVDFRSPSQSGVVPSAPLLCCKTRGGQVPGCPQQRIYYRDHEGCYRGCTPIDGHS